MVGMTIASMISRASMKIRASSAPTGPAVVVAAHPDDETGSAGGRLASFEDLTLVHVTDGAPRDGADARRSGFATWQEYRAARAKELDAAVHALGLSCRRVALDVPD